MSERQNYWCHFYWWWWWDKRERERERKEKRNTFRSNQKYDCWSTLSIGFQVWFKLNNISWKFLFYTISFAYYQCFYSHSLSFFLSLSFSCSLSLFWFLTFVHINQTQRHFSYESHVAAITRRQDDKEASNCPMTFSPCLSLSL